MGLYTAAVQKLYVAYFNRPADPGGLQHWESAVAANGGNLAVVSADFAKSAEYKAAYGSKTSLEAVNTVYQNLFGRDADLPGLKAWAAALDNKWTTIDNIVLEIAGGAKDGTNPGDAQDLTAFGSKVQAAVIFTDALDTTQEALAYNGSDANGAAVLALAKSFISGVKDAATLAAAVAGPALETMINNMVTAHTVVPPITVALTSGIDAIAPSTASPMTGNDTITANNSATNGGVQSFSSFDSIDGGAGTDNLSIVSLGVAFNSGSAAGVTVKNVENVTVTSDKGVTINTSTWSGVTNLTVGDAGATSATAAATTAITVTNTGGDAATTISGGSNVVATVSNSSASNGGLITVSNAAGTVSVTSNTATSAKATASAITVNGGTTVSVTQTNSGIVGVNQENTNGVVTVNGSSATTAVTVTNAAKLAGAAAVAGVATAGVAITDVNATLDTAGKITTVSVSNFNGLGIADNALTSLTIAGGTNNIIIDNSGLTTPTNKTLALSINGQDRGTLDDADIYTTLNVTTTGASSTLSNITFGAMTGLNVAGSKVLTLNSTAGATALKAVAVSGTAGLTADLSGLVAGGSVSTAATTGASTVTINANVATFTGGAGVDTVTLGGANATKAISLGDGNDTLVMGTFTSTAAMGGGAGTDILSIATATADTITTTPGTFATLVTGFERLALTAATGTKTVDLDTLGKFNYASVSGADNTTALTLKNLPTGGTLALSAPTSTPAAYVISSGSFTTGTNDTVNLVLSSATNGNIAFGSVAAASVENLVITNTNTNAAPVATVLDTLTVTDAALKSLTISGNAGLNITFDSLALTSLDASGITLGGVTTVIGNLAAAATVKGSATGFNDVDFEAATKAITYTGGTGIDDLYAGTGDDVINLGGGTTSNIVIKGLTGNHTVTSTATDTVDGDVVNFGSGNNIINLGNGKNSFTATSGNNTYVGGTGVDLVSVGKGTNTITTGTGADVVTLTAASANVNSYSTITDAHAGLSIAFTDLGTETFTKAKVELQNTAVFQDYANAVIQAGGNASVNGKFGWFTFNGDTYVVESRHDGSGSNASFVNGTDMIVKLTGLVDLATAGLTVAGNGLLLA